jgi:ABC-type transport system involved in multi-copper enzyme maturation permease subunit
MTTQVAQHASAERTAPSIWERFGRRLETQNPVWRRELQQAARAGRTPWFVFAVTAVVGLFVCFIGVVSTVGRGRSAEAGSMLYQVFFSIAALIVAIVGPGAAASSIAVERESRTAEALLLTSLTPRRVAEGKFKSAFGAVMVYLGALFPVGAVPFVVGGVTALEVLLGFAFLTAFAALSVAFGMAVSGFLRASRGAMIITLVLGAVLAPMLYLMFGVGGSFLAHDYFSVVTEGNPVWWPRAVAQASFGTGYLVILVLAPIVLFAIPTRLFYEIAVTQLGDAAEDRTSRLKQWFLASTAALTALGIALQWVTRRSPEAVGALTLVFVGSFFLFAILLFGGDDVSPSRRVLKQWERANASSATRFWGPGVHRTMTTVLSATIPASLLLALSADLAVEAYGERWLGYSVAAVHAATFFFMFAGFTAYLRTRTSPWVARVIAVCAGLGLAVLPWMAAALAAVMTRGASDRECMAFASVSPLYAPAILSAIHDARSMYNTEADGTVRLTAAVAGAAVFMLAGAVFFRKARQRLPVG